MSQLFPPVSRQDHVQGNLDAPIVLVEFGDYQCPDSKAVAPNVQLVQTELRNQLAFVFRQFPLVESHHLAEQAAEAAEAAGAQGSFWEMHNKLLAHSPALDFNDLRRYARDIDLDVEKFEQELRTHVFLPRVREHMESGRRSGVHATPTFFVNGIRYEGSYESASLIEAMKVLAP